HARLVWERSPEPGRSMADEAPPVGPVDEAQIQVVALHACRGRDAHAAGVGGRVGEEGERSLVLVAPDLHDETPRPPSDELLERGEPEAAFPGETLEFRVDGRDGGGIQ